MRNGSGRIWSRLTLWSLVVVAAALAGIQVAAAAGGERTVSISRLEGSAFAGSGINGPWQALKVGSTATQGQYVKTDETSRAGLKLPDGGLVRLAPNTKLRLSHLYFPDEGKSRQFEARLVIGRLWARVRKLVTNDSYYNVSTPTAVAGVRGTAFQVNHGGTGEDSLFKVYEGKVAVQGTPAQQPEQRREVGPPREVQGPQEVAGPREVSVEEWTRIVSSWQYIRVSAKGVASEAAAIDPAQDAADDAFTSWNLELDRIPLPEPGEDGQSAPDSPKQDSESSETGVPPIRGE